MADWEALQKRLFKGKAAQSKNYFETQDNAGAKTL
jgi:hypothetical protein